MPTINNDASEPAIHSSEARVLESEIEELRNRLALLESAIHEARTQHVSVQSPPAFLHSRQESTEPITIEGPYQEPKHHPQAKSPRYQGKPVPRPPHKWVPSEEQVTGISDLLSEWMEDESGYDEETWPKLKAALEEDRFSARSLFDE